MCEMRFLGEEIELRRERDDLVPEVAIIDP